MPQVTYARLKNNIAEEQVVGDHVTVTFKCPATEKLFHGVAAMRPPALAPVATSKGGTELVTYARRGFKGLLRGIFATAVTGTKNARERSPGATAVYYDHTSRETAVVEAFETLATQFAWDETLQAYVDAATVNTTLSAFDFQVQSHPIDNKWERGVTARMLAEVVAADGKVTPAEREFFRNFLTAETGTLEELIAAGRVSKLELEECRPGCRATMLMLAYALAMCDERLDPREQNILARYAKGLGVSLDREEQIRHWACEKVIENMLAGVNADGKLDEEERKRITKLAHGIGVNEALVAKIDLRVRKRG